MRYPVRITAVAAVALSIGVASAFANPQLAGLQVALARHALYSGPIDAELGPMTRAAVRRFQAHQGLVPDGIVGPKTRRLRKCCRIWRRQTQTSVLSPP